VIIREVVSIQIELKLLVKTAQNLIESKLVLLQSTHVGYFGCNDFKVKLHFVLLINNDLSFLKESVVYLVLFNMAYHFDIPFEFYFLDKVLKLGVFNMNPWMAYVEFHSVNIHV
jgi:hypothetical protein